MQIVIDKALLEAWKDNIRRIASLVFTRYEVKEMKNRNNNPDISASLNEIANAIEKFLDS